MADFDPAQHRFADTRYFEDFKVGETFHIPSRTMTDALFAAFQLASGDNHPIHYDIEFCRRRGHKHMLAHGIHVFSQTVAGAGVLPAMMDDSLMGMVEASFKVLGPVYCGDTLYCQLEIVELKPQTTTGLMKVQATAHNQDGEQVLDGSHTYLIRKRPK